MRFFPMRCFTGLMQKTSRRCSTISVISLCPAVSLSANLAVMAVRSRCTACWKMFCSPRYDLSACVLFSDDWNVCPDVGAGRISGRICEPFDRPTVQDGRDGLADWISMFVKTPFLGMDDSLKKKSSGKRSRNCGIRSGRRITGS